jgi:chemotaxis protein CheC
MSEAAAVLAPEETEVLQELMNIAFGKAAADLSEKLGQRVDLTVPEVQVMPGVLLRYYVGAELKDQPRLGIVEQAYRGELQGNAFLVLPGAMVQDGLPEVGRILIGACVGKLAELLGARVTFGPVSSAVEDRRAAAARADVVAPGESATVLRALFHLHEPDAKGYLFLASSPESVPWQKGALQRFMAQYR